MDIVAFIAFICREAVVVFCCHFLFQVSSATRFVFIACLAVGVQQSVE